MQRLVSPHSKKKRSAIRLLAGAVVIALIGACGSSSKPSSSPGTTSSPDSTSSGATASSGSNVPDGGDVTIGSVFSRSGIYSAYEIPGAQGTALAVSQINKTGFVVAGKRYHFKVVSADSKSDIPTGIADIHQIVDADHPVAIFGPVVSEIAAPASTFTSAHGVIQVSASSADAALLPKDYNTSLKYMIATEGGANEQPGTDAFAAYIKSIGAKTVAYLYPNDAVGTATTPTNLATFKTLGVKIVYQASFPDTTTDFSPYLAKIAPLHPDLLYFGYATTWMVPILTLAREQNAAKNYFGNVTILPALQSGSTAATNYTMEAPLITQYGPSPAMQSFITTLNAFTGTPVNINTQFSYVFTEYPYVYLLVKAMQEAGTVKDTAAIMKYMRNTTMVTPGGVIPPIQINQWGIAVVPDSVCSIAPSAATIAPSKIADSDIQCHLYS